MSKQVQRKITGWAKPIPTHKENTQPKNLSTSDLSHPSADKIAAAAVQCQDQPKSVSTLKDKPSTDKSHHEKARRSYSFSAEWLSAFPRLIRTSEDRALCKICKEADEKNLFSESKAINNRFVSEGFTNFKKGKEKFTQHEQSHQHLDAVAKFTAMKSATIDVLHADQIKRDQEDAKVTLRSMLTSVRFLAGQGLSLRGKDSSSGNYSELLHLRQNDIPELKEFLKRTRPLTSPEIQNEMLELIGHKLLRKKVSEFKRNGYFSLILDETTDVSGGEQVSICIRSVSDDLSVSEEFLGLYKTDSTKSDILFLLILDVLKRFDLRVEDLRCQCFDGAANMSGVVNGVATKISELEPRCLYVHCYAHCLNLVVQDVIQSIPLIRDCLAFVNDVGVILQGSAKRIVLFEQLRSEFTLETPTTTPRPLCATRRTVRGQNVKSVLENYELLLEFLYELGTSRDKVASKAHGLHTQLLKAETYFGLLVLQVVLAPTENLSRAIQSKNSTCSGMVKAAEITATSLLQNKSSSSFNNLWSKSLDIAETLNLDAPKLKRARKIPKRFCSENPRTFSTVEEKYASVLDETIDEVIAEMRRRFDQPGIRQIQELEDILLNWIEIESTTRDEKVKQIYKNYELDYDRFDLQMKMFHDNNEDKQASVSSFVAAFKALVAPVKELYSEIHKFLKLLLVVPISSATAERSFSVLRRIKDYLRSTMSQERLNHCCVIHCYKEEAKGLDIDEMVKEFVSNDFRRRMFGKN